MENTVFVAIMAGGVGSRFWPASRQDKPKQFLDILGTGKSLIQTTYERALLTTQKENIIIVTNKQYKNLVKEHLPDLTDNQILCEPSRNNTAPCIAYACFKLKQIHENATIVVVPSDHIILKEQLFAEKLTEAISFVKKNNAICTLGISPTRPDTGYGYINFEESTNSIKKVKKFTEKPNIEVATSFLESGDYLWNAGIFIFQASTMLNEINSTTPDIISILGEDVSAYNSATEQSYIDEQYPKTPNISIDYAVMEKSSKVYTIPADIGWSDLGTWGSLFAESDKTENENVLLLERSKLVDCNQNLIRSDRLVVAKGLHNFIIVNEGNTLLIWPKDDEQSIKGITKEVANDFGKDFT